MSARVGKDYAPLTLQRYKAGFAHVQTYLERNYNGVEHLINEVNHQFITGFEQYLKVIAGCQHNSAMKHVKALKKIIGIALARDIIRKNPFANYRITIKPTDRGYLMDHELKQLEEQEFKMERLGIIRDLFLLQCYTGLAYKDLEALSPHHIVIGEDGGNWIFIKRGKTGVLCKIPILTVPQRILDSYSNHPICTKRGKVLPVPSNQKMNAYLKEIATICGINKDLTTHLARHTFATTIALANDMPMETLSKLLGHRKITTTQIYGRILDKKIGSDMDNLRRKLDNR
jgi:site-specific recombinase XerD